MSEPYPVRSMTFFFALYPKHRLPSSAMQSFTQDPSGASNQAVREQSPLPSNGCNVGNNANNATDNIQGFNSPNTQAFSPFSTQENQENQEFQEIQQPASVFQPATPITSHGVVDEGTPRSASHDGGSTFFSTESPCTLHQQVRSDKSATLANSMSSQVSSQDFNKCSSQGPSAAMDPRLHGSSSGLLASDSKKNPRSGDSTFNPPSQLPGKQGSPVPGAAQDGCERPLPLCGEELPKEKENRPSIPYSAGWKALGEDDLGPVCKDGNQAPNHSSTSQQTSRVHSNTGGPEISAENQENNPKPPNSYPREGGNFSKTSETSGLNASFPADHEKRTPDLQNATDFSPDAFPLEGTNSENHKNATSGTGSHSSGKSSGSYIEALSGHKAKGTSNNPETTTNDSKNRKMVKTPPIPRKNRRICLRKL